MTSPGVHDWTARSALVRSGLPGNVTSFSVNAGLVGEQRCEAVDRQPVGSAPDVRLCPARSVIFAGSTGERHRA